MNFSNQDFNLRKFQTLRGHNNAVLCIARNPSTGVDGVAEQIASASSDSVRIWEHDGITGSFRCKQVLEKTYAELVLSCSWNPSGNLFVTSKFDGFVNVWTPVKEKLECRFTIEHTLPATLSWDASGTMLAISLPLHPAMIWEIVECDDPEPGLLVGMGMGMAIVAQVRNTKADSKKCHTKADFKKWDTKADSKIIKWHPSVNVLFRCDSDCTIIKVLVPCRKRKLSWVYFQKLVSGGRASVQDLAFNSNGDKLVSYCDRDITIWGADVDRMMETSGYAPWVRLFNIVGFHDGRIYSVHWSSEGIICSGAGDGALRLFVKDETQSEDETKYRLLLRKESAHDNLDVNSVLWCLDNMHLASAGDDGTIKLWELASSL